MYNPAPFRETRPEEWQRFIAAHPLATLIAHTVNGLDAAHLPLVWHDNGSELGVLHGHFAKANPLWQSAGDGWLAIFHHPGHYISPNWYPSKARDHKAVPTWNYQTLHAHGHLRLIDDPDAVWVQLSALTAQHEAAQSAPWQLSDAPEDWIRGLTRAIVCFEMTLERIESKYKMNQHHPLENRLGAIAGLQSVGTAQAEHVAACMRMQKE